MRKSTFSALIKADIEKINREAAWTADQAAIFKLLLPGTKTDAGIMHALFMSSSAYYQNKKEIRKKIERILQGD